jgi:HK97 family phage prohead protease
MNAAVAANGPATSAAPLRTKLQEALEENGGLVTRSDALVVKAIRESTREVDFVASTGIVDSHGDVIDQDSWQLEEYLSNPVALYGHQTFELPIGSCSYVAVRNGKLECTIKFSDATQRAKEVFALVVEKTLRAVSVGFRPVNGSYEIRNGSEVWVWRNAILKEISVVAIGANPEALAKMKAALGGPRNDLPAGAPASTQPKAGAPGENSTKGTTIMKTAEQLAQELAEKTASHAEAVQKLGAANVRIVEAEQKAEKADASRVVAEKSLANVAERVKSLELAARTLEAEHTKACTDRDAATKKASELEDKLIDLEVEGIVGKKITPVEKAEFVELRKSNEKLFKSMVDKRPDMKLEERVTTPDSKENRKATTPTGGDDAVSGWNGL